MEEQSCTHQEIFSQPRSAAWLCANMAMKACAEDQDMFNFFQYYWCDLNGNKFFFIVSALLLIFLIFKYTSIAVEEYIAQGIQNITDWLKISDSLAAVTLLAFANGAGDVITAIVASDAEGGVSLNIGSLYGAGLFGCAMVVGICILQSKDGMSFDSQVIYRDVFLYIGATLIMIFFAWYKSIEWWSPLILFGWYIVLVLAVVFFGNKDEDDEEEDEKDEEKVHDPKDATVGLERIFEDTPRADGPNRETNKKQGAFEKKASLVKETTKASQNKMLGDDLAAKGNNDEASPFPATPVSVNSVERAEVAQIFAPLMLAAVDNPHEKKKAWQKTSQTEVMKGLLYKVKVNTLAYQLKLKLKYIRDQRKKSEKSLTFMDQLMMFIEGPFLFILNLTVLPCDEDQYTRKRCLIYPLPGMLFAVWVVMQEISWRMFFIALVPAIILEIFFYCTLNRHEPPKYFIIMNAFGVIGGLMWCYILVNLLIDLLSCVGLLLNLDNAYLGLTILAVGNALTDALTTITLCKQGSGDLALSGVYAGQLFALLIGFGLSMLKLTLTKGPQPFDLFDWSKIDDNIQSILVIGTTLLVLVSTFIYSSLNGFVLKKPFGFYLFAIYAIFIIGTSFIAIKKAIQTTPL